MVGFAEALSTAASGMQAQAQRIRYLSENIANSDTPGYRRKLVSFEEIVTRGANVGRVELGEVRLDQRPLPSVHDPSHPLANGDGYYQGSNVDLLVEITDAREAGRSYDANLKMFEQLRGMSTALLDLLRR